MTSSSRPPIPTLATHDDGILVQQSEPPPALPDSIKQMHGEMRKAGFIMFKTLPFPQPAWWSAKPGGFDFLDADARANPFAYRSADIHAGARTLPPSVAEALGD